MWRSWVGMAAIFLGEVIGGLAVAAPGIDIKNSVPPQGNAQSPPVRTSVERPRPAAQPSPPLRSEPARPAARPERPAETVRPMYRSAPSQPSPATGRRIVLPDSPSRPRPSAETGRDRDRREFERREHGRRWARGGTDVYLYVDGFGDSPYNYGYYGYFGNGYPYDYPPVYVPAELFFGQPLGPTTDILPQPPRDEEPPEPKPGALRGTNAQSVALAWKFINAGDLLFSRQQYAEANDRYRKASNAAPQLVDAWFRQGFALAATNRYELSSAAFKRALQLDATWPRASFDLDDLFGRNAAAKRVRLDAMADAAVQKPNDFERLFVLGVHLHFDGQTDRATKYFAQAQHVAGGDEASYPQAFLAKELK